MAEELLSVGLDVGTTSTQLIVSKLSIENKASSFAVPELEIAERQVLYKSPIHFTPLLAEGLVDGEGIRRLVEAEYCAAGITRHRVDTGAVIITGETSRKENAAAVLKALSDAAGNFVVATAGPHLESVLAAKGAGADTFSAESGKTVLHIDIGGGTSNLALIREGQIAATGCMNVGGRLLRLDKAGKITYRSPALDGLFAPQVGEVPTHSQLEALCTMLAQSLEMAAGLRPAEDLLNQLWTTEAGNPWLPPEDVQVLSFSGGVADCIDKQYELLAFGDIGPLLGAAIQKSMLCAGSYRLGSETIRATVIGAGCHSAQLSGSTVFHRGIEFPLKNLPVVSMEEPTASDVTAVISLPGLPAANYRQITTLAQQLITAHPHGPLLLALEADMAKALGQALALRVPPSRPILCIDRVKLTPESYLDVGAPIGSALPVVVKTLIFNDKLQNFRSSI